MLCGIVAGVWPLALPASGLVIMEFAILIWGSVQVFGAYKAWTYDPAEYSEDFCEYTPMVFAFVVLIMKWVRSDTGEQCKQNIILNY